MKRVCAGALGLATTVAVTLCLAGTAMAGTSVVSAIHAQDKAVGNSPVVAELKHLNTTNKASVKKLIPALKTLDGKLSNAADVVSKATASGSKQTTGQKDWVDGVKKEAAGLGQIATGLQDALKGDKTSGLALVKKGAAAVRAGGELHAQGDKLLGLPTKD